MSTWIVISLPEEYKVKNYLKLYNEYLFPIINKYKGTEHKCVCDGFTESEHKFKNLLNAKKCAKEINILIKNLIKNKLFNFDMKNIIKPQAMVMPKTYEKNGDRTIIRPDYSYDKSYKAKSCGNFKF
jgi:hypothetical protein